MPGEWPHELDELLPGYLSVQRWFHGDRVSPTSEMSVKRAEQLWADDSRGHALWHLLLLVGPECYQLVIAERPADERAEFLHGREESVVGVSGGSMYYDATVDADLVRHLLEAASGGRETATLVRPV